MLPRLCCIQEIGRISKADRCFLTIEPVLAQPQNMPRTIAVRKAKETMAASTLSLILNSILASFAGMRRLSGAGCAAPIRRVYGSLPGVAKKNRLLQCINIAAQPVVSRLPHRRC
jgi:hypothetical protein